MSTSPQDQIRHETKILLNRYDEECDLDDMQIIKCVKKGIKEWLEEDVIDFDPDPELLE